MPSRVDFELGPSRMVKSTVVPDLHVLDEDVATVASGLQLDAVDVCAPERSEDCLKGEAETTKMKQGRCVVLGAGSRRLVRKIPWVQTSAVTIRSDQTESRRVRAAITCVLYRSDASGRLRPGGDCRCDDQSHSGLAASLIGPNGGDYRDPKTDADISTKNSWVALMSIVRPDGLRLVCESPELPRWPVLPGERDNIVGDQQCPTLQNTAELTAANRSGRTKKFRGTSGCSWARCSSLARVDKRRTTCHAAHQKAQGRSVRIQPMIRGDQ